MYVHVRSFVHVHFEKRVDMVKCLSLCTILLSSTIVEGVKVSVHEANILGDSLKVHEKVSNKKLVSASGDTFTLDVILHDDTLQTTIVPRFMQVRFQHVKTKIVTYLMMTVEEGDVLTLNFPLHNVGQAFQYLSGAYTVHVVLGDASFEVCEYCIYLTF